MGGESVGGQYKLKPQDIGWGIGIWSLIFSAAGLSMWGLALHWPPKGGWEELAAAVLAAIVCYVELRMTTNLPRLFLMLVACAASLYVLVGGVPRFGFIAAATLAACSASIGVRYASCFSVGAHPLFYMGKWGGQQAYATVRDGIQTGDILLCSDGRKHTSRIIRFFTRSPWCHVAVVVRDPPPHVVAAWGLDTAEGGGGALHHNYVFDAVPPRVRMLPMREWLRREQVEFPWQVLALRRLTVDRQSLDMDRFHAFVADCGRADGGKGVPYEPNDIKLALSAYALNPFKKESIKVEAAFCSQLVAEGYKRLGLLPSMDGDQPATYRLLSSNNYTPQHFSSDAGRSLRQNMRLLRGAELDDVEFHVLLKKWFGDLSS